MIGIRFKRWIREQFHSKIFHLEAVREVIERQRELRAALEDLQDGETQLHDEEHDNGLFEERPHFVQGIIQLFLEAVGTKVLRKHPHGIHGSQRCHMILGRNEKLEDILRFDTVARLRNCLVCQVLQRGLDRVCHSHKRKVLEPVQREVNLDVSSHDTNARTRGWSVEPRSTREDGHPERSLLHAECGLCACKEPESLALVQTSLKRSTRRPGSFEDRSGIGGRCSRGLFKFQNAIAFLDDSGFWLLLGSCCFVVPYYKTRRLRPYHRSMKTEAALLIEQILLDDPALTDVKIREPWVLYDGRYFQWLIEGLENNTHIKSFGLSHRVVERALPVLLKRLLEALGRVSSLEAVNFSPPKATTIAAISSTTLAAFVNRTTRLKSLLLFTETTIESTEAAQRLADALENHSGLKQLGLMNLVFGNEAGRTYIDPILDALPSIPTLEEIHVAAMCFTQQHLCPIERPQSIGNVIAACPKLRCIALRNLGLTDEHCEAMTSALQASEVTNVDIRYNAIGQAGVEGFLRLARDVGLLEYVDMDFNDPDLEKAMDVELRLNRVDPRGRLRALGSNLEAQSIESIARASDDTDALFRLLKMNPSCIEYEKHV